MVRARVVRFFVARFFVVRARVDVFERRLAAFLGEARFPFLGIPRGMCWSPNMRDVERLIRPISQHDSRVAHMQ